MFSTSHLLYYLYPPICSTCSIYASCTSILPSVSHNIAFPVCRQPNRKVQETAWRLCSVFKKTGRDYIFCSDHELMCFCCLSRNLITWTYENKKMVLSENLILWRKLHLGAVLCAAPSYLECRGLIYFSHQKEMQRRWTQIARWNYPRCSIAPAPMTIWRPAGKFSW